MSRSRHTEAQMIAALKQVEAGRAVEEVAREVIPPQSSELTYAQASVDSHVTHRGIGSGMCVSSSVNCSGLR